MISPWADLACTGESLDTDAVVDLAVTKSILQRIANEYLRRRHRWPETREVRTPGRCDRVPRIITG
jgi:hypothetical protein